ncbi:peptidoglycan/LPS O-acetylase OafA/YrhL [Novosphingobium chloroacetimidivorans]|uniref:Peptidoglycan/LPS O-acetylase OafA/YrhL n=1 Tax=Novosphingobium chloroacetimidivorans TaxID=1428314 RepID=A0A7W7NVL9_9SPHN|nr:acyltransferase [Novosphingobium chloroacetimidivorans]MBB4858426.1 peptidoglycan/LPS O-acetylase OafA/YrhL [Novosphingobium chloroacetimidivorans]
MGLLRVLLAIAVLVSHTGMRWRLLLVDGPVAVQIFYIVSGFYMGLVLNERYDRPALNRVFYVNRLARIYPVYLVFLALYVVAFAAAQLASGNSPLSPYLQDSVSLTAKLLFGLLNLTVVGQDIAFYLAPSQGHLVFSTTPFAQGGHEVFRFMAIPMAWSLALELYFYALAPFIARRPVRQIATIMGLSLVARIAAALLGISADPFSYRFFPFELALFLAGVLGYKVWAAKPELWRTQEARILALAAVAAIVFYPVLLGSWSELAFFTPARVGTLTLAACALPAIHEWSRTRGWDRRIAELSFPLYLGHLLIIGLVPRTGMFAAHPALYAMVIIAISLLVAWLVVRFVERGIEAWRRQLAARAGASDSEQVPRAQLA